MAIAGAAQTAVISAQPIPKFKHGTQYHKGGLAEVGHGKPEAIITPEGNVIKSPSTPTIMDLKRGTKVMPDFDKWVASQTQDIRDKQYETNTVYDFRVHQLVEKQQKANELLREIANNKGSNVSIDLNKKGLWESLKNEYKREISLNYHLHRDFKI